MNAISPSADTAKYPRCIEASKAGRWELDRDVIRGRTFDTRTKYLPDGLSLVRELPLPDAEARLISQIQGRTYANVFSLVDRFITAKLIEVGRDHTLGDQHALEALARFSDEEIKHQAMFRRIEQMIGGVMPAGYRFDIDADAVARAVLSRSTWSVLVLTLHIELFVQLHYRESIAPDRDLSALFKDVFLHHWMDERQHAVLDELELKRLDAMLDDEERDRGVDDFIDLVSAVDALLQVQATSDAAYFSTVCGRRLATAEADAIGRHFLKAYRWQYILSGASHPHFQRILKSLVTGAQLARITAAVGTLA